MNDAQKFEGFKRDLVEGNERQYGAEARERYGDSAVDESNRRMMNLTKAQYDEMTAIAGQIQQRLEAGVRANIDPNGEEAKAIAELHKNWLSYSWAKYAPEAHKGLAQMYVDDPRFTAHYDAQVAGCAKLLRDAVHAHM